jgi:hypothetical protein
VSHVRNEFLAVGGSWTAVADCGHFCQNYLHQCCGCRRGENRRMLVCPTCRYRVSVGDSHPGAWAPGPQEPACPPAQRVV